MPASSPARRVNHKIKPKGIPRDSINRGKTLAGKVAFMRTTIAIDDDLLRDALSATGAKSKREVIELGLNTLVRLKRQEQLRKMRGKGWEGNLDAMRADE